MLDPEAEEPIVEEKPKGLKEIVERRKIKSEDLYGDVVSHIRELFAQQPYVREAVELFADNFKHCETCYGYDQQFQDGMYLILISPRPVSQMDYVVGYYYQTSKKLKILNLEFPTYVILCFDSNLISPGEMQRMRMALRNAEPMFEAVTETVSHIMKSLDVAVKSAKIEKKYSNLMLDLLGSTENKMEGLKRFGRFGQEESKEVKLVVPKWIYIIIVVLGVLAALGIILSVI